MSSKLGLEIEDSNHGEDQLRVRWDFRFESVLS